MKKKFWKTTIFKIIIGTIVFSVFIFVLLELIMLRMTTEMEETLIADRLEADINYIEDIINDGQGDSAAWHIGKDGCLYYGVVCLGDGTDETANIEPFLEHTRKTDTFSYVFIKCSDEGLEWVGDEATGYEEGHFLRVAGSTRSPSGDSIVGTKIEKSVADVLDAEGRYVGEANVAGGMIYCVYETLENTDGEVVGAIVVGRNVSELSQQVHDTVAYAMYFVILGVFVIGFVLVLTQLRWSFTVSAVTRHLSSIMNGIIPKERLKVRTHDEMEILVDGINSLVDSLSENELLRMKSETDPMTGLANRNGLNRHIDDIFDQCYNKGLNMAIGIIDIDCFKECNDNYGHQYGDEVIKAVADTLHKANSGASLFAARYGGDEFVLVCSDIDKGEVSRIANNIRDDIAEKNLENKYSKVSDRITISQGFCVGVPKDKMRFSDFLYIADKALYDVKNVGKGYYRVVNIEDYNEFD